ncbi:MAG TPA: carboxypeptidase regulatory-like domain-containing protein, partial [Fibrella sp.]
MARTLRYWLVLLFSSVSGLALAQTGEIAGAVLDEKNEPVINAQVFVFEGGLQKGATVTDFDGLYSIKPLAPGSYDIRVSYSGYKTSLITGVTVSQGGTTLNFKLERATIVDTTLNANQGNAGGKKSGKDIEEVVVTGYRKPLIDPRQPGSINVITAAEIEKMPTRNPLDNASTAPGVYQGRSGGALNIGGGRSENTLYVVDGIVQVGSRGIANMPFGSIAQMSVITGGLPARYGDATGGVVSITTKGVTQKLQGSVGAEHSVDGFNNRQAYFNVSGPLISRRDSAFGQLRKRPIVGFVLSGNFINNQDAGPSYDGNYVARQSVRDSLEAMPLVAVQGTQGIPTLRNATELITEESFEVVKRRPRAATTDASLIGKLDFQLGNNMNLTIGGQGFYGENDNYNRRLIQFSPDAISRSKRFTGRSFVRFTQRFPSRSTDSDRVISNAFYSLQADYQKELNSTEDPRFGKDIFKYGYLGKFYQDNIQTYTYGTDTLTGRTGIRLNPGFQNTNARFERSELNPVLANYTSAVYELIGPSTVSQGDIRNIRSFNGLLNGDQPSWTFSNVFSNVGTWQTGYNQFNNDQISVGVDASLDLKTRKTTHSLEFGMYYQQRTERAYALNASLSSQGGTQSLWERAYLLTNTHFDENFDYSRPRFIKNGREYSIEDYNNGVFIPGPTDTILYNYAVKPGQQSLFDLNLRRKLGITDPERNTDYINVYEIDPSLLSVDMFSADELFNAGRSHVNYYGYDYKGQRQTGTVTFNDFFTAKDADGRRTRPVAAFQPNYIAGYLSDNFRFRDILFNVGVRVDRYDANTKVLRDPYSLYAVRSTEDVSGALNTANGGSHPGNMGPNYVVYIDNNNSSSPRIAGYRNGDDWYNANGIFVDDPGFLKEFTNGTDPQPYLQN